MKNYYNKLTMTFPVGWAENGQLFLFLMPDTTVLSTHPQVFMYFDYENDCFYSLYF